MTVIKHVSDAPDFKEWREFQLGLKAAKVDPSLLKRFHKRLESLRKLVVSNSQLLSYVSTLMALRHMGMKEAGHYRVMEKNKMNYIYFKELRLTELCNECEAIMSGRLQYGSVCKRCQKRYDDAIAKQAMISAESLKTDALSFWEKLKSFFK